MSEPLPALEKDRSEVLRQISHLGDLRPGSIVEVMGRCGKPNCHCAQPGRPRPWTQFSPDPQGPRQDRLGDVFPARPPCARRSGRWRSFTSFRQLSAELVEVNEKICQLRPGGGGRGV